MNKKVKFIAQAGIIAALYVAFSWVSGLLGLSSGAIQVRISDALCMLVAFTPAAIPGVTIGCLIYNLTSGCILIDVFLGSLASLIGCAGGWLIWKAIGFKAEKKAAAPASDNTSKNRGPLSPVIFLMPLPYILANAFIVPTYLPLYGIETAYWLNVLTVGAGEVIACGIIGILLYLALYPVRNRLF